MTSVILIIIGITLALWLSTISLTQPDQGQLSILTYFNKHIMIVGNGIPDIAITKEIFDVPGVTLPKIKIDGQRAFYITIWPFGIETFEYRYKRFRTLKEVTESKGSIRWQPKTKDGTPNTVDTMVLGEWKESNKKSLFVREREEIAIPFLSLDGYRGTVFAYMKYLVWDCSAAISTTYQFKTDPEKSTIDKFQKWARGVKYLTKLYGVSFDELPDGREFIRKVNANIYLTGVLLEDIEFFDFVLDPESQDLLEAQEKIKKANIDLAEAKILQNVAEALGEGEKKKKKKIAEGDAYAIDKTGRATNTIQIALDKNLKSNEVAQFKSKQSIERENEVKEFKAKTQITLSANGKIIEKIKQLKKTPDATMVRKYTALGGMNNLNTLILHGDTSGGGDKLDELLESNILANQIINPKKGGSDGTK